MKPIYYIFLAVAITITSCKNNDEETDKSTPKVITPFTQQTTAVAQTEQQSAGVQQHNLFHENNTTGTPSVVAGINPAHGQPNHRCDIAVGAPLNSKPAGPATTTTATPAPASGEVSKNITVQPPVPSLLSTSSANTETAEGMNPPHGQAGHRCDIAVGAPLPKS